MKTQTQTIPVTIRPKVLHVPAHRRGVCAPSPVQYAADLGEGFTAERTPDERRPLAQFFTPLEIARFMGSLARPSRSVHRFLDPGAGSGLLACALCEVLPHGIGPVHLDAYEVDAALANLCHAALTNARQWLTERGTDFTFTVHQADFVIENAAALTPTLWSPAKLPHYDIAISNPPYFKLRKQDARSAAASLIVHGQPNIYALFMAIMASLLAPRGVMITITPRSFTTGNYFRRLRQHLFSLVVPEAVHLFDSRKDPFRNHDILQENVILRLRRTKPGRAATVTVSTSVGAADIAHRTPRHVPLKEVVDLHTPDVVFHIPADETDDAVIRCVRQWPNTLHRLGLQVSTGPVVAFRARQFLVLVPHHGDTAPLLWLHNVRPMRIEWPLNKSSKAQYIADTTASRALLLPNATYVVLRRFSAKEEQRRLTAAPLLPGQFSAPHLGLENHLNYIRRPGGSLTSDEAMGLAGLLSSTLLDRYFRVSSGHTQVNATELRALPLPSRELITALGQALARENITQDVVDAAVNHVLTIPHSLSQTLHTKTYA